MKITNRSVAAMRTTNLKGQRFYDSELRGFAVRVMPDGSRYFEVRYGGRKNRRRLTIGRWGPLTLEQGRQRAEELLAAATLSKPGEDSASQRQREREMPTFSSWKTNYVGRISGRLKSAKWIERFLTVAEDKWGARRLDAISPADVENAFQEIGKTSPTSANRFAATLRACLAQAVRENVLTKNPAENIRPFSRRRASASSRTTRWRPSSRPSWRRRTFTRGPASGSSWRAAAASRRFLAFDGRTWI